MDEALRDLAVLAAIAALCFVGAAEYVYWRFGFDKIVGSLSSIQGACWSTQALMEQWSRERHSRHVA